jgi:Uma2 family endonuclease
VDGILVEKAMGYYASVVAAALIRLIGEYVDKHDLGVLAGPDGVIRLAHGLARAPDVAFFPWRLFPNKELPSEPIPDLVPELVVEVLSESNTPGEMARKHREYFDAGVKLIWEVDPEARKVRVLTGPDEVQQIEESGALTGADVLPGFRLPLKQLFQRAGLKQPTQGRQARGRKERR